MAGLPTLLVVDDDVAIRAALADVLADEGYTVVTRPGGQEALDYLRQGQRPDVIILDLWMPRMDGWVLRGALLADSGARGHPGRSADRSDGRCRSARAHRWRAEQTGDAPSAARAHRPRRPRCLSDIRMGQNATGVAFGMTSFDVPAVSPETQNVPGAAGGAPGTILVVDDDEDTRVALCDALVDLGHIPLAMSDGPSALRESNREELALVLTDLKMPGMNGIELCRSLVGDRPDVPVIVMTAFGDVDAAVAALRAGAFDFITKPLGMDQLSEAVNKALRRDRASSPPVKLRPLEPLEGAAQGLIGPGRLMAGVRAQLARVAATNSTVLVTGDSGTGKEFAARAIHLGSDRREAPLVAFSCAAVPRELVESEALWSRAGRIHRRIRRASGAVPAGAWGNTHAGRDRRHADGAAAEDPTCHRGATGPPGGIGPRGRLRRADRGGHQQEPPARHARRAVPRGSLLSHQRAPRSSAAAPRARGRRHPGVGTALSLERGSDLPPLDRRGGAADHRIPLARQRARAENAIGAAVALANGGRIGFEELPTSVRSPRKSGQLELIDVTSLQEVERRHIEVVLRAVGGNKVQAARKLGIDRATLYRKLERLELNRTRR